MNHLVCRPFALLVMLSGVLLASAAAQAPQGIRPPLVPCEGENTACVTLATQPQDIVGIWKQYLGNPMLNAPGGMGFIRYNADGTYVLADTPENTAGPYQTYPRGTFALENGVITIEVEGEMVPPECRTARYELRVFRYGDQPVALHYAPVEDACVGRLQDLSTPLVWVAGVTEQAGAQEGNRITRADL